MQTNVRPMKLHTHEGATAKYVDAQFQLRRSVMACLLWEDTFYESGVKIGKRIKTLVAEVDPFTAARIAIEARYKMKIRHAPMLIVREMARLPNHKKLVSGTIEAIVQRPDELAEFLALYWKDGRQPVSAQVKKGLARAFTKFDAYQIAKYNRDKEVKLRDVLFLSHAKPNDEKQAQVWRQLVDGKLQPPDTWEVNLSSGKDKKETWERLLSENKLGAMALLRNLRNMVKASVDEALIRKALQKMKAEKILPFRFIAAAKHAVNLEPEIESAMLKCLESKARLPGKTILLIDVSGSMTWELSQKSEMVRHEAASGLAILLREICEQAHAYTFDTSYRQIPARRGFALRDAITREVGGGTHLGHAVSAVMACHPGADRLIVITDEQSHDRVPDPQMRGYMINVAAYKNGVGYGPWLHVDGWSESVIDYIVEYEKQ